jgi:two-component system response regulator CpxR
MSVITVFAGTFCKEEVVLKALHKRTGFISINDNDLIAEASKLSGLAEAHIGRAFSSGASVFNKFSHEKENSIAHLRLALARLLSQDQLLISGFVCQLIPRDVSHVLRTCLIADLKSRTTAAIEALKVSQQEAQKLIRRHDEDRAHWVDAIAKVEDPWSPELYDMVLPTDKMTVDAIVDMISESSQTTTLRLTDHSRNCIDDFLLAAKVEVALVKEGHLVGVQADAGNVTLTINKHVLMLSRLENELKSIASKVPGVHNVNTVVGPDFYQADIYRKQDFTMPSKILLVDDEREFVQTLSERLLMRDMGSAVAYDGESALEVVREDEPDVMILDLKMPGIDGIEVLRRVKATQPEIEVIILTGHGSDADRDTCMALGAFAYLQKPVDVEVLSETIKSANEKIRKNRETAS